MDKNATFSKPILTHTSGQQSHRDIEAAAHEFNRNVGEAFARIAEAAGEFASLLDNFDPSDRSAGSSGRNA